MGNLSQAVKSSVHGAVGARAYSLEKAQTKTLPLTCVMEECGWSEIRFGPDAVESGAVPWTYATTGPFDQS